MQFAPKNFHFSVACFPLAVIAAVGLVQLIPNLIREFSVSTVFAMVICIGMIWFWWVDCRKYASYMTISVSSKGIAFGESYVDWAEIKSLNVFTQALNPYVAIELEEGLLRNDDFELSVGIYLTAYKDKLELLRALKKGFEGSSPDAEFRIPSSTTAIFASWLWALCGATIFFIVLMFAIGAMAWWLYGGNL